MDTRDTILLYPAKDTNAVQSHCIEIRPPDERHDTGTQPVCRRDAWLVYVPIRAIYEWSPERSGLAFDRHGVLVSKIGRLPSRPDLGGSAMTENNLLKNSIGSRKRLPISPWRTSSLTEYRLPDEANVYRNQVRLVGYRWRGRTF
jgi:hypothetical protein